MVRRRSCRGRGPCRGGMRRLGRSTVRPQEGPRLRPPPSSVCVLIMCLRVIQTRVSWAAASDGHPSIGWVTRVTARWSCSRSCACIPRHVSRASVCGAPGHAGGRAVSPLPVQRGLTGRHEVRQRGHGHAGDIQERGRDWQARARATSPRGGLRPSAASADINREKRTCAGAVDGVMSAVSPQLDAVRGVWRRGGCHRLGRMINNVPLPGGWLVGLAGPPRRVRQGTEHSPSAACAEGGFAVSARAC